MKRLFMIFASAVVAAGLWACPMSVMAMPDDYGDLVQDQDTGSVDTWDVDTSWFDYLDPKTQYTISTEAQLRGLASLVNEEQYLWKPNRTESFEGVTFVLTRDITLTDAWTPIGIDNQITFAGVFDGKGHSISSGISPGPSAISLSKEMFHPQGSTAGVSPAMSATPAGSITAPVTCRSQARMMSAGSPDMSGAAGSAEVSITEKSSARTWSAGSPANAGEGRSETAGTAGPSSLTAPGVSITGPAASPDVP